VISKDLILQILSGYDLASFLGVFSIFVGIVIIALTLKYTPKSYVSIGFDLLYEKVYEFYESILGKTSKKWIKTYIVILFFVIFIANMFGVILEILAPIFGMNDSWKFILEHYIKSPSSDLNFNLALASVSILILVYVQFSFAGTKGFLYDYFPIFGKWYITLERGKMKSYIYYPLSAVMKFFDIVVSLFLGVLEMVGLFAKVISLSFRLFGNMTSGTVLLGTLVVAMSAMSEELTMFIGWWKLPIVIPVIIYLQEILVACIQAMVFPLLVAIFIKATEPIQAQEA